MKTGITDFGDLGLIRNGNIDDILAKEIESWKAFRYALREEDGLLFNEMLSECGHDKDYVRAVSSKGENYSTE